MHPSGMGAGSPVRRKLNRAIRLHFLVLVSVTFGVSSCSGDTSSNSSTNTTLNSLDSGSAVEGGDNVVQLLSIRMRPDEFVVVEEALERVIATCMEGKGHQYVPNPPPLDDVERQYKNRLEFYELPRIFEKQGDFSYEASTRFTEQIVYLKYIEDGEDAEPIREDPNLTYVETLGEQQQDQYMAVLNGSGNEEDMIESEAEEDDGVLFAFKDGCVSQAEMEIFSSVTYEEYLTVTANQQKALRQLSNAILEDSQLGSLNGSWSSCMTDQGWPEYGIPLSAFNTVLVSYAVGTEEDDDDPAGFERKVAADDFACRAEAGLDDDSFDARVDEIAGEILAEYEGLVVQSQEIRKAALEQVSASN